MRNELFSEQQNRDWIPHRRWLWKETYLCVDHGYQPYEMADNRGVVLFKCVRVSVCMFACTCAIWVTAQQSVWMDLVKAQTLMQLHSRRFMMWNTKGKETMIAFMRCHFLPLLSLEFVEYFTSFTQCNVIKTVFCCSFGKWKVPLQRIQIYSRTDQIWWQINRSSQLPKSWEKFCTTSEAATSMHMATSVKEFRCISQYIMASAYWDLQKLIYAQEGNDQINPMLYTWFHMLTYNGLYIPL